MEPNLEGQQTQKTVEELQAEYEAKMASLTAELEATKQKADVSSQNFERAKKAEAELKELKANGVSSSTLDAAELEQRIDDKVALRLSGHTAEQISEIEAYAKGRGIKSLLEASKVPFVAKAVEAMAAEKKSIQSTPAPSSKIKVFGGKPVSEVFTKGGASEKQQAFESVVRGGVRNNE